MTEAEWLACTDPKPMREFLWGKVSERKLRLFACACCRRVWKELGDRRSRQAVIVAERYADGQATAEELDTVSDAAYAAWDTERRRTGIGPEVPGGFKHPLPYSAAAYNVAIPPGWWGAAPAFVAPDEIILEATADREAEGAGQCVLLRDLFGNPFRPVSVNPGWLSWHGGTVPKLAEAIYQERAFDRLPVLADALEEAGCTDSDILGHCREPGPHTRGCWVVDALLGKS